MPVLTAPDPSGRPVPKKKRGRPRKAPQEAVEGASPSPSPEGSDFPEGSPEASEGDLRRYQAGTGPGPVSGGDGGGGWAAPTPPSSSSTGGDQAASGSPTEAPVAAPFSRAPFPSRRDLTEATVEFWRRYFEARGLACDKRAFQLIGAAMEASFGGRERGSQRHWWRKFSR